MSQRDHNLPDAGEGMCCYGSAVYGAGGCTCWDPVHDVEQQPPRLDLAPADRSTMCGDCAFRPDSPERSGDARYQHSGEGDLDDLVYSRDGFACHVGMRRVVALVHPSGARVEKGGHDYDPPVVRGVAFKADGSPAERCAGLRAARVRAAREAAAGRAP